MNKSIEAVLAEAEELISQRHVNVAFDNLIGLFQQCSQVDLKRLNDPIMEIIDRFLPKKRRKLSEAFRNRLDGGAQGSLESSSGTQENPARLQDFVTSLQYRLDELSEWHIFQWSTYYKDELRAIVAETLELLRSSSNADATFGQVAIAIQQHSCEIFTKGYSFVMSQN